MTRHDRPAPRAGPTGARPRSGAAAARAACPACTGEDDRLRSRCWRPSATTPTTAGWPRPASRSPCAAAPAAPAQWQLDLPDGDGHERLRVPIPPDDAAAPDAAGRAGRAGPRRHPRAAGAAPPGGSGRAHGDPAARRATAGRSPARARRRHAGHAGARDRGGGVDRGRAAARRPDDARSTSIEQRLLEAGLRPAAPAAEAELDRLLRPAAAPARRAGRAGRPGPCSSSTWPRTSTGWPPRSCGSAAASRTRCTSCGWRPAGCAARCRLPPVAGPPPHRPAGRRTCASSAASSPRPGTPRCCTSGSTPGSPRCRRSCCSARCRPRSTRHFARVEAEAGAAVLSALDGESYAALRSALDELLDRPPLTKRAARPATQGAARAGGRTARRLQRAMRPRIDHEQDGAPRPRGARRPQGRQAAALRHRGDRPAAEGREAVRRRRWARPHRERRIVGPGGAARAAAQRRRRTASASACCSARGRDRARRRDRSRRLPAAVAGRAEDRGWTCDDRRVSGRSVTRIADLRRIAFLLERAHESTYRVRAFRTAAAVLRRPRPRRDGRAGPAPGSWSGSRASARSPRAASPSRSPARSRPTCSGWRPSSRRAARRGRGGAARRRCAATATATPTPPTAARRCARWWRPRAGSGHEYLVVTDHSPRLTVANGLSARAAAGAARPGRRAERRAGRGAGRFRVLTGIEVDINEDGTPRPGPRAARRARPGRRLGALEAADAARRR